MGTLSRRDVMKLGSSAAAGAAAGAVAHASAPDPMHGKAHGDVPIWEVFELTLDGPQTGNPFLLEWNTVFRMGSRTVTVPGFYDGGGKYKARYMPDAQGEWSFVTVSDVAQLNGHTGSFRAGPPLAGAHGPVVVHNTQHFAHADGAPYFPFGTTSYAWIHQPQALQQRTLATLKAAPFNKIRMCVFPKHYEYNHNEPEFYPFPRTPAGESDFTRFDPRFFAHVEACVLDLQRLGIEADLILFHPYDRWGYQSMSAETDAFYLRYIVARMGAYRNVWWSMANEWDLMRSKTVSDFDRLFHVLEAADAHGHLRSIHHSVTMYDHGKPWVTHASLQTDEFDKAPAWLAAWKKPLCFDEVKYEGNLNKRWGNLSAQEMVRRFWLGVVAGCYVTHGETYLPDSAAAFDEDTTPTLWWSHGGELHGQSSAPIALLRRLVEETAPAPGARMGLVAQPSPYYLNATVYGGADGRTAQTILYFMDQHQPIWYEFPLPPGSFRAELINTETGAVEAVPGTLSGRSKVRLRATPYQAVRFLRV